MSSLPPSPLVSIVTPSFNQGRFIDATIRSVFDLQNYPRIEYLVMDGASTDDTLDVLRRHEPRLQWISQKDAGQSDAINKGFARTSGQILGWLNSDDTYTPGAIRRAVEFFNEHPDVAVVYGDANFIDPAGQFIARCAHIEPFNRHRLLNYSDFIVQPAAFFRREAFEAVGGLDASLHWAMDYDLWLKLARRFKIAYLPRTLANYRWLGTNKSADGGWNRLNEVEQVARRYGATELPAFFRLEAILLEASAGVGHARRSELSSALDCVTRAIGSLCRSPRAIGSVLDPRTWRVIYTGQVLRRSAARR